MEEFSIQWIRKNIEKVEIESLEGIKKFRKFKYPKLVLLGAIIILTYFIFKNAVVSQYIMSLGSLNYVGMFIAGILFSFGFSAPLAVGFFIIAKPSSIILASLIAGTGALISNMLIFKFIKFSFMDEVNRLEHGKAIKEIEHSIKKHLGLKVSTYLLYILSGIFIASPLPNEIGVIMIAGLSHIKTWIFALTSFILSTFGVLIILILSA